MGLLWGEELVGCLYCCPATYPIACPQTRKHSSFIVSMTLSVVFAVLSYTHSLELENKFNHCIGYASV